MQIHEQALDHVLSHLRHPSAKNLKATRSTLQRLSESRATSPTTDKTPETVPKKTLSTATSTPSGSECANDTWEQLRTRVVSCVHCANLATSRTQTVFGTGNPNADILFVGEAPGADEDRTGEPFVGEAGQLLTKIIGAMGLTRDGVFMTNVLKCRPDMSPDSSGSRPPTSGEMAACLPYLKRQIQLIQPKILVALGQYAMQGLFGKASQDKPMRDLRGQWHDFEGIPVMATYHPSYLLRNSGLSEKRKVWEDMLLVLEKLKLPINERQRNFFLPKT